MQRNSLIESMRHVLFSAGGSFLTRQAAEHTLECFARYMKEEGFVHLRDVSQVNGNHLRRFFRRRKLAGVSVRTMQNEAAHLRGILRQGGRASVANAEELSNKNLEIAGGARKGTKSPASVSLIETVLARAHRLGRPGFAALVQLELLLGLRGNEALHADVETIERWIRELANGDRIEVIRGTKGGRARSVVVFDRDAAVKALNDALLIAQRLGSFLLARKDGKPVRGLKEARSIYHSWMHRAEIQPHSLRYAFAQHQIAVRLAAGFSKADATAATSLDLGHGDGRGRWVVAVYCQSMNASDEAWHQNSIQPIPEPT